MAKKNKKNNQGEIINRAPVVAIMGHIDHGKSTLLDYIRKENTVDGEAGGITQHVAAYEAEHNGKKITFIDTPGHEAFAAARSRGANIADIAVLVVSADDGVKEQTLGAIKFIKDSKIPFIVAINKIDKPNADIQATKNSLLENEIYLEGMGGDISYNEISALKGTGVDELLETILLTAEVEDLKADTGKLGSGYILEAKTDPKKGLSATMILKDGHIKTGQYIVSGFASSPVRIMEDFNGKALKEAIPSAAITITGFDEIPAAGDSFAVFENKKEALKFVSDLKDLESEKEIIEKVVARSGRRNKNQKHIFPLIIKADVQGSVDAIKHQLEKVNNERSEFKVVLAGTGNIGDKEMKALGGGSNATIVGFNVSVERVTALQAENLGVEIKTFDIIYQLEDYLKERIVDLTPKETFEEVSGEIKVLKQFS
jgi:translation initiation factor IF-2